MTMNPVVRRENDLKRAGNDLARNTARLVRWTRWNSKPRATGLSTAVYEEKAREACEDSIAEWYRVAGRSAA